MTNIHIKTFTTLILFQISSHVLSNEQLNQTIVPNLSEGVLLNGFFELQEWKDAKTMIINDDINLHFKQDSNYLYLGIQSIKYNHTGIDLSIAINKDNKKLFHVSSALAEATFEKNLWSDHLWEQNKYWSANKIGLYQVNNKRQTSKPEGFEFQINKTFLSSKIVFIAFDLKRPDFKFPQDNKNLSNWIKLEL